MKSYNHSKSPEEIENEIEQTRARMAHTLDAIQEKFSPGHFMDQALHYVNDASGEFGSNLGNTVKHNPVPVALVAIGLGWLLMSNSNGASRRHYPDQGGYTPQGDRLFHPPTGAGFGETESTVGEAGSSTRDKVGETVSSARDKVGETASGVRGKVGETVSGVRHRVGEATSRAYEKVGETAGEARYQAARLGDRTYYQARRARSGFQHMLQEQPLVLGALGLAIGAALGAGLPRTRREDELMGETRDELVHRAEAAGREQLHKAQRVAEATQTAVMAEAERQGLTREAAEEQLRQAQSKVQSVAETARDSAKQEAERQGLTREATEEQLRQAQSKVQSVAETARDAAKQEADKQGLASRDKDNRQSW